MTRSDAEAYGELLVLRAQGGDQRAMSALVEQWQPQLLRHAWRLTGDREAAGDAVQEAWLAIVRRIRRLDDPACFRRWAYRIVGNKCADWVRHRVRSRRDMRPLDQEPAGHPPPGSQPRDEIEALRMALAHLPTQHRTILSLFYLDDMSIREIAQSLSLPAGTVKSRLFHARKQLKQVLERST